MDNESTDNKDMIEVHIKSKYISQYRKFSLEDWIKMGEELFKEASENHSDVYFMVDSTMEPYENCPGDASVSVWGYRKKTKQELKTEANEMRIQKKAKDLGMTPYEVVILEKLKSQGKV